MTLNQHQLNIQSKLNILNELKGCHETNLFQTEKYWLFTTYGKREVFRIFDKKRRFSI